MRRCPVAVPRNEQGLALLVRFFKGLANPGRLRILEVLLGGEKSVSEIVAETGMAQAQVSNALACLRWCGFVRSRPDGRRIYYSIANQAVCDLLQLAERMVAEHTVELYSCTILAEEADDAGDEGR